MKIRSVLTCQSKYGVCSLCYGRDLAAGNAGRHRHGGGHHRRAVDRRAGHAADAANLPHRRRRDRRHHHRSAACRRNLRSAQAQGPSDDLRSCRTVRIGDEQQQAHRLRGRFDRRGARVRDPAGHASDWCRTGQHVEPGDQFNEGSLNPHDILRVKGETALQNYLVQEVQKVYRSQGVDINDKHIEVIVRSMLRKVKIVEGGDTPMLPGQLIEAAAVPRSQRAHARRRQGSWRRPIRCCSA